VAASAGASYAIFRDQKTSTPGGTFTSGAWRTRDINDTQHNGISGASISSNQIILPAGSYYVNALLPAYDVNANVGRLQNITDTTTTITGQSVYSGGGGVTTSVALIAGYFTIAAQKTFEVQHRSQATKSTIGFGVDNTFDSTDYYTIITITKVA
jgi:hypothetical protein